MENIIEFLFYGSMAEEIRNASESILKIIDKPIFWIVIFILTFIDIMSHIREIL